MDKIEKIRAEIAEIERRMKDGYSSGDKDVDAVARGVLAGILNFLDTLEEEPGKSLEEEIQRYLGEECSADDEPSVSETARHFAEWGAEHLRDSTKMIDEFFEGQLDAAIRRVYEVMKGEEHPQLVSGFLIGKAVAYQEVKDALQDRMEDRQ